MLSIHGIMTALMWETRIGARLASLFKRQKAEGDKPAGAAGEESQILEETLAQEATDDESAGN